MEIPDKFLTAFNVVISDLNDTPLHDAATNVKTEKLQLLLAFSTWYDVQLDKIDDITLGALQEGKFQFSAKDFDKFYTDINQYLQSIEFRSATSKLAEKNKSVDKVSVFQILTNLIFNLQSDKRKEVKERSEKGTPNIPNKISTEQELNASARGKIRYVSGYVVAKLKYKNSKLLRNTIFAPGKEDTIKRTKLISELLDSLRTTYSDISVTTADPEGLFEIQRKQNKSEGLCNITDCCFNFFLQLEEQCRQLLTYESLLENRSEMYIAVEKTLLEWTEYKKSFFNLPREIFCKEHGIMESELDCSNYCDSKCKICDIMKTLYHNMVTLFVKVSMAQFRRDYLSALKVDKGKALRKKVMEKSKAKTKQLDSNFLQADDSENKHAFHLRLKNELCKKALICDVIPCPQVLKSKSALSEIVPTIDTQNTELPATELPVSLSIIEQPEAYSPQPGPSTATCSSTLQPETDIANQGPLSESDS
ncbi:unnamed protein product [Mytilus coruscus]|uniref:Uncharacterized protein n=1 Tax=Mytilus coruscus TaxID=42192 RepID=A0A6J8AQJ2_MYTCO|nr:unnamed protein product [Mytilus coruscus]